MDGDQIETGLLFEIVVVKVALESEVSLHDFLEFEDSVLEGEGGIVVSQDGLYHRLEVLRYGEGVISRNVHSVFLNVVFLNQIGERHCPDGGKHVEKNENCFKPSSFGFICHKPTD